MGKRQIISLAFLLLGLGFALGSFDVHAQQVGYDKPEAAFESALSDFMTVTRQIQEWTIGEVILMDNYAYSAATSADSNVNEQGHALLLARQDSMGLWHSTAPRIGEDAVYNLLLAEMPDALIDSFSKDFYYQYSETEQADLQLRAVSSHSFPWPIQEWAKLTQKNGSYHTNQLDFVIGGTDDIYSSKPGTVVFVKDVSTTGGCNFDLWPYANMVVVKHSEAEYSWYLHLKAASATVQVGDVIGYGTKIGEQGNTGFACGTTGIHLHFMASTAAPSGWPNPTVPNYAPWPPSGTIVPVDFREKAWAGLSEGTYYESANAPSPGICNDAPGQVSYFDGTYCSSLLGNSASQGLIALDSLGQNDQVESVEIPPGWSVELYPEANEIGTSACLDNSDAMLWDDVFTDGGRVANNITWMRIYQQANCPYVQDASILFYTTTGFSGDPIWGMTGARMTNGPHHLAGSIYVPDDYSAVIYDQDNFTGNALCLAASVPDLAAYGGWDGVMVESVNLVAGDICESLSDDVPIPVLIKPANQGVTYIEGPQLCWQVAGNESDYSYNIQIGGEGFSDDSGWIGQACWTPQSLGDQPDDFNWKVRARNALGIIGDWSAEFSFSIVEDTILPEVSILSYSDGMEVLRPRTVIRAQASDHETWVSKVYFFAWFDDGSEAGYDWHYLGVDNDPSDGWNGFWGLANVFSNDAALWVYAEDVAGNFSSVFVSDLLVVSAGSTSGGSETRAEDNTGGGGFPETGPEINGQPAPVIMETELENNPATDEGSGDVEVTPPTLFELEIESAETDRMPPIGVIHAPLVGSSHRNQVRIVAGITDVDSGVGEVTYLAWFDDGAGPAWHELGVLDSADATNSGFLWDLTGIAPQEVQIWIYFTDQAGNLGAVSIGDIQIDGTSPKGLADPIGRNGDD